MADDFERRQYDVVRYSLEEPYINNIDKIKECDIVFIAVPTPSTPDGFSYEAVESALSLVSDDSIAVIKSTMLPGTTRKLQDKYKNIIVMHSPEFLREKFAVSDTSYPPRNIIGVVKPKHRMLADVVLGVLPKASYHRVVSAESAECIKYIGNNFLYTKIVFFNIMYDMVMASNGDWDEVRESVAEDSRIGHSHTNIIDQSGDNTIAGRGAGGHCFIKDFEATIRMLEGIDFDKTSLSVLKSLRDENNKLLKQTNKDIDLLEGVYGK